MHKFKFDGFYPIYYNYNV